MESEKDLVDQCNSSNISHQVLIDNGIIWTCIQQAILWSNLVGCILTWISFRYRKRVPILLLFASCLSDTLVAICTYSFSVASYWVEGWVFGQFGCYYYALSRYFFQNLSFHIIVASSMERFVSFVWPFVYDKHFAVTLVNKVLLAITLYTGLITLIPLFGPHSIQLRYPCTYCNFEWSAPKNYAFAWITIVNNVFGVVTAVFCNCIVIIILYRMAIKHRENRRIAKNDGLHKMSEEKEMTFILVLTSLAFCISWIPHTVFIALSLFDSQNKLLGPDLPIFELWSTRIIYANSILCPYIYIFGRRRIRSKLCNWIRRGKSTKGALRESTVATRVEVS